MTPSGEFPTLEIEIRDPHRRTEGERFAESTNTPIVASGRVPEGRLRLVFLSEAVELWDHDCVRRGTRIDFTQIDTRIASGNISKNQPLAKAVGRDATHIVDSTAGFGHDAFLLACMGYTVTAFERNPFIHLMLNDALTRAQEHPETRSIIGDRLRIEHGDSRSILDQLEPAPDTIYLDPMFESGRSRSALPKKPAQILRNIVGEDVDSIDLFETARRSATRVVVKRTDGDPPLVDAPTHSIKGKIVRYDVYINT